MDISVCIPSYRRPAILLGTIREVIREKGDSELEVIVVDQTPEADLDAGFYAELERLKAAVPLTYVRRDRPNSNAARNEALSLAKGGIVVYFDDDVLLAPGIFGAYLECYRDYDCGREVMAVAGECHHRDMRSGVPPEALSAERPGHGARPQYGDLGGRRRPDLAGGILTGCNMSFRREYGIRAGGFDEQLTSYFDEGDFSKRLEKTFPDKAVVYDPAAYVVHLRAPMGGHRLTVAGHGKSEVDIVFSQLSYWLRHHPETPGWRHVLRHLRLGPLRKENLVRFWRQPHSWWSFVRAVRRAYARRDRVEGRFAAVPRPGGPAVGEA